MRHTSCQGASNTTCASQRLGKQQLALGVEDSPCMLMKTDTFQRVAWVHCTVVWVRLWCPVDVNTIVCASLNELCGAPGLLNAILHLMQGLRGAL